MLKKSLIAFCFILFASAMAGAQTGNWGMGPHLLISLPQQGFDNLSKDGEGIGGKVFYRFNNPYLSLRADLGYLSYGERRNSEMIDYGYYTVTRRNESFQLTMGPQLTYRIGAITPYASAQAGLYYYHTVVSVQDFYGYGYTDPVGSQTKWGWNTGGGILIDLGIGPYIDLGFKYQEILDAETKTDLKTIKQTGIDYCITLGVVFFRD